MNIAFIPARAGSRGVPDKNIRDVCGRPLIDYTICAAEESDVFDAIVVDTDSERVVEVVLSSSVRVHIHRRRDVLGKDDVHAYEVLRDWCRKSEGVSGDANIVMLLPTCPLRSSTSIRKSFETYICGPAESPVISVYDSGKKEQHIRFVSAENRLERVGDTMTGNLQREQGRAIYILNGGIYWWKKKHVLQHGTFHVDGARCFVMPLDESIDVDTFDDLDRVRTKLMQRVAQNPTVV